MARVERSDHRRARKAAGFTLVELLVVILIVMLLAVAALPTVVPAITHRQVSEAARLLQAGLVGARDRAMQANAPRGLRFLPDPAFMNRPGTLIQAANRWVQIETAPDYTTGQVSISPASDAKYHGTTLALGGSGGAPCLIVYEALTNTNGLANENTSWAWNIRVGDKFRFADAGRYYTIVGPMVVANPEGFINYGTPGTAPLAGPGGSIEYLFLVNGQDDNLDGYVDNGFDGVDNNFNNIPPQSPPLIDLNDSAEWEIETWVGPQGTLIATNPGALVSMPYTINRRPVPAQTGLETVLPADIVIDLTTFNTTRERSRVPIDPITNYVEIMVNPNGQVEPTTSYSSPSSVSMANGAFYHFWLAERKDVFEPVDQTANSVPYLLPMPETAYDMSGSPSGYPATGDAAPRFLTGERTLVTLYCRSGNIVTNSIEFFSAADVSMPFYASQIGYTEAK